MIVIGITGTNGAGKGTIVKFLKSQGFKHFSVKDYLIQKLQEKSMEINRINMQDIANEIRQKHGSDFIIRQLFKQAQQKNYNAVIESVRSIGEAEFIKSQPDGYLFSIDAKPKLRYKRISGRSSSKDKVTYEQFLAQEKRETNPDDPNKQNLPGVIKMSDYKFHNNGTIQKLYAKVGKVLDEVKSKIQKN